MKVVAPALRRGRVFDDGMQYGLPFAAMAQRLVQLLAETGIL
jgi:hypothetical protein